jgi:hypothetical protein
LRRSSTFTPIHIVAINPPMTRGHYANSGCWCHPIAEFRDLNTTSMVYVHRPWSAQMTEGAQEPASGARAALKRSDAPTGPTGTLWDVALAYRTYGDAMARGGKRQ